MGIAGGKPHSAHTDAHLRVLPIKIKSLGWAPSALSMYSHRMATPRQNQKGQPQRLFILNIAVHSAATRKTKINNGESGSPARKGERL